MKQLFFLGSLLLTFICNAQLKEEFEKGWFINKENIKIEGYIKKNDLSELSSSICFKPNLEEKKHQFYTTNEVKSFHIGNGNTFDLLNLRMNNKQLEVELFLNLIVKGDQLSLYKGILNSNIFYVVSKKGKNYVLQNDELISGELKVRSYYYKQTLNLVTERLANRNNKKIKFKEDYFIKTVTEYNNSKNATVRDLRVTESPKNYLLTNIGYGEDKSGFQYYGQVMFRKYKPKISRRTSLNIGVNYFNYQSEGRRRDFTRSFLSIPLQLQHNLLNKKIRPYIFTGFSINYTKISHEISNFPMDYEPQKTYSLYFLYGTGIEIDILKNIYFKIEYRNEVFSHPIMFGLGYIYDFKNK